MANSLFPEPPPPPRITADVRNVLPKLRIGTSSFSETSWVGPFYEKGTQSRDMLREYAKRLDTVEIDATYYAVPARNTVIGWREKTPDDFLLAAKFPGSITHAGDGPIPDTAQLLTGPQAKADTQRFLDVMAELGHKQGPLLIQFPRFNKRDYPAPDAFYERLADFLATLPDGPSFAVEVRNADWLQPTLLDILREHGVALALTDIDGMPLGSQVWEEWQPIPGDHVYIRLLGNRREIEAVTTTWGKVVLDREAQLQQWADFIVDRLPKDAPVFLFVNNHYAGHSPETIRRLSEIVNERLRQTDTDAGRGAVK